MLDQQTLPITVKKIKQQKILILSAYPRFELRQFKNWLANNKHHVFWRSKISKDNYRFEYLNSSNRSLKRISNKLLSDIDLLILDTKSFQSMSSRQRLWAVEQVVVHRRQVDQ